MRIAGSGAGKDGGAWHTPVGDLVKKGEPFANGKGQANPSDAREAGLDALLRYLRAQAGLDFRQYKPNYLKRRIGVRMRATGCSDYMQYRQFVRQNPEEIGRLINDLTINVTEFFRDTEVYEAIRSKLIPEIMDFKRKCGSFSIRAWSAGCATGEEPYSLSILFQDYINRAGKGEPWMLRITATDLDDKAIAAAKEGYYEAVRLLPGLKLEDFFAPDGSGYRVLEAVKRPVRFLVLDIMRKPPLRHLDLILCRNVLIYFEKDKQEHILRTFHQCLRPGGFLVLGKSEAIVGFRESGFAPYNRRERIYKRT